MTADRDNLMQQIAAMLEEMSLAPLEEITTRIAEAAERAEQRAEEQHEHSVRLAEAMERIAEALEHSGMANLTNTVSAVAAALQPADAPPPGYRADLADYPSYCWPCIDAEVISRDQHGATVVSWHGRRYTRRTHPRFGDHIWFSRATGRDEAGDVSYERLITFDQPARVEDLPPAIVAALPPTPELADYIEEPQPTPTPQAEEEDPDVAAANAASDAEFNALLPRGDAGDVGDVTRAMFFGALTAALQARHISPADATTLKAAADDAGYTAAMQDLAARINN